MRSNFSRVRCWPRRFASQRGFPLCPLLNETHATHALPLVSSHAHLRIANCLLFLLHLPTTNWDGPTAGGFSIHATMERAPHALPRCSEERSVSMRQLDSSQRPFMALAPALILALLAVALAACSPSAITGVASPTTVPSATSSATRLPTPTPVPHAAVVRVSKVQHFADSMSGGTSSPCANGDPLISGDCGVTVTVSCPGSMPLLSGG